MRTLIPALLLFAVLLVGALILNYVQQPDNSRAATVLVFVLVGVAAWLIGRWQHKSARRSDDS